MRTAGEVRTRVSPAFGLTGFRSHRPSVSPAFGLTGPGFASLATPDGVEPAARAWKSVEVSSLLTAAPSLADYAAEDRPWQDIPGVVLVGILMGLGFLLVAVRAMFKKK